MNSVRLDPFSAKLLAIRARGKSCHAGGGGDGEEEEVIDTGVAVGTTASCCTDSEDDSEDDSDDGDDSDSDHADDAVHADYGDHVATTTSMLPIPDRVVDFTGCDTCDKHVGEGLPTMADLMAEISDLKARVQHLEERATPAG